MRFTTATVLTSLALLALGGCKPKEDAGEAPAAPAPEAAVATPPAELTITEIAAGSGPAIASGSTAVVHYTGWFWDANAPEHKGAKFDSSRDGGKPFSFKLSAGEVIDGWVQGVAGMQVGDRNLLIIPPALAYGADGMGTVIPPNSTLIFDVELLEIK